MRRHLNAIVIVLAVACAAGPVRAAPDDPARLVAAAAAEKLEAYYVYPARAREAGGLVRRNAGNGAYDGLRDNALATRVTADLASVLHDKHVRVAYSEQVNPPEPAEEATPSPERRAAFAHLMRQNGYGLGRIAHLPGNVGYIDVRAFPDADAELKTVFDGMVNAVGYSEVLILDLRRNHGGSPDSVARLLSHFLPTNTHVEDFVGRGDGEPQVAKSTYTEDVPGPRITAPVYVLTSNETFSGGEECAYDFQTLKRGTLIGMVTGGGANPGRMRRIDDHFAIFVPSQRARNPITNTNWEGVGVKPDIAVPRDRALITAFGMAVDTRLRDTSLSTPQRESLTKLRAKLDRMSDAEILAL